MKIHWLEEKVENKCWEEQTQDSFMDLSNRNK